MALLALALFLGVPTASAATRHASPGANGPEPCAAASPCSAFTAITGTGVANGDEVILAPGEYTDTAGDLGPPLAESIQVPIGVEVRGEAGKPRPRIVAEQAKWSGGVFGVQASAVLAHLEITAEKTSPTISVFYGTIEGVIARNTAAVATITCTLTEGTIRDSVCLASAPNAAAVGVSIGNEFTYTPTLRSVTAIATGSGGVGLSYVNFKSGTITVDAKSVIALGDSVDIKAEGLSFPPHTPGTGGHVTINIDHSVYNNSPVTGIDGGNGTASVNDTNGINVTPLLAADGYHQLKGSPTINAGAVDDKSGASDVDGQERTIGPGPDVGADEYANPTILQLVCDPLNVVLTDALPGPGTDCTATVTDTAEGVLPLSGSVSFSSSSAGDFTQQSCALNQPGLSNQASCGVNYKPRIGSAGAQTITAVYGGNGNHDGSQGVASITVEEKPFVTCAFSSPSCKGGGPGNSPRPTVKIVKKPAKKSSKRLAKFTFTSNPSGASFECKLDAKPFKRCSSPFKRKVESGQHTFKVRAVNSAGKSKPKSYTWTVGSFNGPTGIR